MPLWLSDLIAGLLNSQLDPGSSVTALILPTAALALFHLESSPDLGPTQVPHGTHLKPRWWSPRKWVDQMILVKLLLRPHMGSTNKGVSELAQADAQVKKSGKMPA